MFFCYFHTVRFWSISTLQSFQKNKYQIQSYMTFSMDDFKTILLVFAYFLINRRIYLVSNMFPRDRYILNSFELWTQWAHLYPFCWILFLCSCHFSKHLSLCELFWYPSPEDGYWNRNVERWLYIIINSPICIVFFCYLHTSSSRQVQLHRKQYLINRGRHRHVTSKGMDSYR